MDNSDRDFSWNNNNLWLIIIGIVTVVAAVLLIIGVVRSGKNDEIIIDEATTAYEMLMDDADDLKDKIQSGADDLKDKAESGMDNLKNRAESGMDNTKSYYLNYDNGRIVIYNEPDRTFYDYADVNYDIIPDDIRRELEKGMHIDGEDSLYDFLQTYSS